MSARDLSGFGAPTTPRPTTPLPRAERRAKPASNDRRPARKAKSSSRRQAPATTRITLSLPIATAEALRLHVAEESTYYLDVILHCHDQHTPSAPPTGLRRRRPPGRIQIPLNIPADRLREIDGAAEQRQLSRSNYLTEILDRHFDDS